MADRPLTPDEAARADPFAPPAEPCECYCLHCQRAVDSAAMWYQAVLNGPAGATGFWMCPTPNCDGKGFTFDLFPTDPAHPGNAGWSDDDEGDEDSDDGDAEYDPDEPHFADEGDAEGDDDELEGEEWKHGLQPGERPPESPEVAAARAAWEAEQRRYDEPDRRPRTVDGSRWPRHRADPDAVISDDDIPF